MRKSLALVFAVSVFFVTACGDSYGRSDAIDEMIDAGLDEETANCIADGAEDNDIPWDATEDSMSPGGEHYDVLSGIVEECVLGE